jgi:hypothetical protein
MNALATSDPLVHHQSLIDGERLRSLVRASSVLNCQTILVSAPLRSRSQFSTLLQGFRFGDTAREALPGQRAEFDFGHIEPRTVVGRVMDLQAVDQPLGLGRRDGLVEVGSRVGVELVQLMSMGEGDVAHSAIVAPVQSPF